MTATLLDTIIMVVIFLSVLIAFFRGFVKEMITIISIGGATYAAYKFGSMAVPSFNEWLGVTEEAAKKADYIFGIVPPKAMAMFLAYASVFFGVFIVFSLAGMAISTSVTALGLGPLDKILGMGFGAARGFLIVFLMYVPVGMFLQKDKLPEDLAWVKESFSYNALDATYQWADQYFKDEKDTEGGENTAEEERVDPDSFKGKLKNLEKKADEFVKNKTGENGTATPAEDNRDMLTDDETNAQ